MSESYKAQLETAPLSPEEINIILQVRGEYDSYTDEQAKNFILDFIKPDRQAFALGVLNQEDKKHNIIFLMIYHHLSDGEKKLVRNILHKAGNTPIVHKIGSKLQFYYSSMKRDKISPEDWKAIQEEQKQDSE